MVSSERRRWCVHCDFRRYGLLVVSPGEDVVEVVESEDKEDVDDVEVGDGGCS
jgi:hypothetical protein